MPEPLTNAERQRRWRERQRAEKDPVMKMLRSVLPWAETHGTAGASRLALQAATMLAQAVGRTEREHVHVAQAMGVWKPTPIHNRYTATEASRIALRGLESAQAALDGGSASEREVSAGLAMAKHLLAAPRQREGDNEASLALIRALAGIPNARLAPAHLRAPAVEPTAAQETDDRDY